MNAETLNRIREAMESIHRKLVAGDYAELEQLSHGVRLSAADMRAAIADYGQTLRSLPAEALNALDVVEVTGAEPSKYSVGVNLWTVEEGRSDLSLEVTLIDKGSSFAVEIDDIHVL